MADIGGPDWWRTADTGEQPDPGEPPAPRSRRALILGTVAVLFFVAAVAAGVVAVKQNSTAGQWRSRDRTEVVRNQALSKSLSSANASIVSLNSQVSALHGHVVRLQSQISAVADAKAKALDQNAVLSQLNNEADSVSQQLSTCVDDMNTLLNEFSADVANGSSYDPQLQSTASIAGQDCSTAQSENQQLQATLSGVG